MSSRINPCSSWFSVRRPAFNKNKPPPSKFSKAIFAPGGNTFFTAGDHEILESRMRKRGGLRSKTFWEGTSTTRCEQHLLPMIFKE